MTRQRLALSAAFVFLGALYLLASYRDLGRGPHLDEVEHLHTAARMAQGDRIYIDFAQHHPPLFHGLLMPLVGDVSTVETMRGYVTRARLLVAALAAVAIAAAALVVWRVAGNPWTVVVFVGLVFAAREIWRNGLGDVRPDTAALALWWVGAALVLCTTGRDRLSSMFGGLGVGLVFAAALMMPRWPLMSLVIGIVLLVRIGGDRRALVIASAAALLPIAAALGAISFLGGLRRTYFFAIELSQAMFAPVPTMAAAALEPAFSRCPPLLHPINVLLGAGIVAAAWFRVRSAFAERSLAPILLLLPIASLCEIRFFYPYPAIDRRYYLNWVLAAAALLALMPQAAAALLHATSASLRKLAVPFAAVCVVLVLAAATGVVGPPPPRLAIYWRRTAWMLERMGPGDTVWLGHHRPIGAADASYYSLLGDVLETALRIRETENGRRFLPPIADADLPPCRLERGLEPNLRFLCEPGDKFPSSQACFERLVQRRAIEPIPFPFPQRGVVDRTPFENVWMVPRS